MHPLDDAYAKLDRAETHLKTLDAEVRPFLNRDPYPVTTEPHPEKRGYILRAHVREEIPHPDWSVLAGDCIHNVRSALDHLAWQMAGADPEDTVTQFPVFNDPDLFVESSKRMLSRITDRRQIAFVKWLQPYRRQYEGTVDFLWMLHCLDIADKHKLLVPVSAVMEEAEVTWVVPAKTFALLSQELFPGPFVEGTEVGELLITQGPYDTDTGEPTDADVQVNAENAFEISLDDPSLDGPTPLSVLGDAIGRVRSILDAAAHFRLV